MNKIFFRGVIVKCKPKHIFMKCNIGNTDKKIRIFLGVLLIAVGFFTKSWLLGIIGSISIITGFTRFCLLYVPFKINTNKN